MGGCDTRARVVVGRECVRVRKVKPVRIVRQFDMWQMFVVGVRVFGLVSVLSGSLSSVSIL